MLLTKNCEPVFLLGGKSGQAAQALCYLKLSVVMSGKLIDMWLWGIDLKAHSIAL